MWNLVTVDEKILQVMDQTFIKLAYPPTMPDPIIYLIISDDRLNIMVACKTMINLRLLLVHLVYLFKCDHSNRPQFRRCPMTSWCRESQWSERQHNLEHMETRSLPGVSQAKLPVNQS